MGMVTIPGGAGDPDTGLGQGPLRVDAAATVLAHTPIGGAAPGVNVFCYSLRFQLGDIGRVRLGKIKEQLVRTPASGCICKTDRALSDQEEFP